SDKLYDADFHNARVDDFDSSFNLVSTPGAFVDKKIPRHFAPYGIQNINGAIFVTYARQDKARMDDVPGAGRGFVDMFDTSGNFMARIATKGALDAPWGLALAPSDFGPFSGDLLVGKVGDGGALAYTPANLTVQVGDTVRWVWGSSGHSVVSGTNGNADNQFCSPSNTGCDNPLLSSSGATYEHTFTQAGTFPYYCSVHFSLGMTGTITVQ